LLKAHAQVQGLREILKTKGFSGILTMKGPLPKFPPVAYFLTLLAAGFGFPVSEDLLVVYATVSEFNSVNTVRKIFLFACVWLGVVGSDLVTYFIGSIIRRTTDYGIESDSGSESGQSDSGGMSSSAASSTTPSPPLTPSSSKSPPSKSRLPSFLLKLPPIPAPLKRLLNSPFVGFYVRLMFGFRGPMMLWAGYERIGPIKFLLGSSVGALGSMGIQGAIGLSVLERLN
jgi:membrane protein DedA with SNARE-associated domain